jgi:anti-anti-sigma factor
MAAAGPTSGSKSFPYSLRIATVEQGTTTTIEFDGEWDLAQRAEARDAVAHVLERRPECLVIDLSRLSFIDSTGIHILIETHERCIEQETHLVIVPSPGAVQRVFEICGLTGILPLAARPELGAKPHA